jgi:hypothetical protein
MPKTLIIATVLLPRLTIALQFQQLPQSRHLVGWMASGSYYVPSDKAPATIAGSRESGNYCIH